MSDFIEEMEDYVDELIEKIGNKMKDVNKSARKCVEMQLEGVSLATDQLMANLQGGRRRSRHS